MRQVVGFERRVAGRLTLVAYSAAGGVAGALARRADELYGALDAETRTLAQQLFLRLVQVGDGGEVTRQRVRAVELPEAGGRAALIVEGFTTYRLLTTDRDPAMGAPTVELAHEALIDSWDLLREWIDRHRDELRLCQRLALAAGEWLAAGLDAGFLAAGPRLAQLEPLAGASLNAEERAFLEGSTAERERATAAERVQQERLRASLARSEADSIQSRPCRRAPPGWRCGS